jgi:AcrR family transcriptional regulator
VREPRSSDRRVQRTRGVLRQALVDLILERGWEDITIQDICRRAAVGRSTFYTHYADKEDLLLGGFDDLRQMLREVRGRARPTRAGQTQPSLAFTLPLLEHVRENLRVFRALVGRRSGHVVEREFRRVVVDITLEEIVEMSRAPRLTTAGTALGHCLAGALTGLITWWLDARTPMSPQEVQALFQRHTAPLLAAALRAPPP